MSNVPASLIEQIAINLEEVIIFNIRNKNTLITKTVFDAKGFKEVSIKEYIQRVVTHSEMEVNTLKYAILLLKKYCAKNNFYLLKDNCFKLILACVIVALKVHEDCIFTDKDMALIGGISLVSLIKIESEILESFDYKVANIQKN